jgi:hypothetical protein
MSKADAVNYFVHTLRRARDWQNRPQLDEVAEWWCHGCGVCALIGMGGAGKTAIAERFVDQLLSQGQIPFAPNAGQSNLALRRPHGVFIYSFYDDDIPENFFRHLQIWLEGTSAPKTQKSPTQLIFDIQQRHGLIVLDGLELIQESSARDGFGRLTDPSLRALLSHIACGVARELRVLVTSRFPLADLLESEPRYFKPIVVDKIAVKAGIALLRDRGVCGTDAQLARIVEHCGQHALTVDLAGGYIKEYRKGDSSTPLDLGSAEELLIATEQEPNYKKRAVLTQGIRFTRIAQRYRDAMRDNDQPALAILERICLFRRGVDCETFVAIFTGPTAARISGNALANMNAAQVQMKLDWLVNMRIVEESKHSTSLEIKATRIIYSIHPAVRDGFLREIGHDTSAEGHEAIRRSIDKMLKQRRTDQRVQLESKPGAPFPTDHATLDLMEDIIHHALATGNTSAAWEFYQNRMGGCKNLIAKLNDFPRASRVTEAILRQHERGDKLPADVVIILRSDYGYSCLALGRVVKAGQLLSKGVADCYHTRDPNLKTLSRNLASAQAESGHLRLALQTVQDSLPHLHNPRVILDALLHIAHLETYCGRVHISVAESDVRRYTEEALPSSIIDSLPLTVRHESLDMHRYRDELEKQVDTLRDQGQENAKLADACLDLSETLLWHSDLDAAFGNVSLAYEWAIAHEARSFLCRCALARARILISRYHLHQSGSATNLEEILSDAESSVTYGLKIARDCGYGIYHVDLLLERAHYRLCRSNPGPALEDVSVALDDGVPANAETGRPELPAARHPDCGYAWAIPNGLQLRGESLLLQAAQLLGRDSFVVADRLTLPSHIQALICQAEACLNEALQCWQPLRDPQPNNANFIHPDTGTEYNCGAAATHRILVDLADGMLTRYPLEANKSGESQVQGLPKETQLMAAPFKYHAFISYRRQEPDRTFAHALLRRLEANGFKVAIDERDFDPVATFLEEMERCIQESHFTLAVASPRYFESGNCVEEAIICKVLDMSERRRRTIPLTIEKVEMPTWLYNIVGINFTDDSPLVDPHEKLITKLRSASTPLNDS